MTSTKLDGFDPVLRTTCPCDGIIVASGVTLDIGGTLRGSNACAGVLIEDGANDVTVRHGKVVGFYIGVEADNATGVTVTRVQSLDNGLGVLLGGFDLAVTESIAQGNESVGIFVIGSGDVLIRNNRANGNGEGFALYNNGGGALVVSGNVASRNVYRGFEMTGLGPTTTVELNRAELNGALGFLISGDGSLDVAVLRNVSTSNGLGGTVDFNDGFVMNCVHCHFDRNRSFYNGGFGIFDIYKVDDVFTDSVYTNNLCGGNALGDSAPPGLCR